MVKKIVYHFFNHSTLNMFQIFHRKISDNQWRERQINWCPDLEHYFRASAHRRSHHSWFVGHKTVRFQKSSQLQKKQQGRLIVCHRRNPLFDQWRGSLGLQYTTNGWLERASVVCETRRWAYCLRVNLRVESMWFNFLFKVL